jgi:hypothetical protein
VSLQGIQAGDARILIGRLVLERDGGRITNVTLGDLSEAAKKQEAGRADFTAHLNPPGTLVDFGQIATDGSVKINKEKDHLTIFPYPRDVPIRLSFDVKALVPDADLTRLEVRALEAGTQEDLGRVDGTVENGRLALTLDRKGAGKYVVM